MFDNPYVFFKAWCSKVTHVALLPRDPIMRQPISQAAPQILYVRQGLLIRNMPHTVAEALSVGPPSAVGGHRTPILPSWDRGRL